MLQRPALPIFHPVTLIATWFGTGLIKGAPGTWGSLAALPFAYLIVWWGGLPSLWAATLAAFFAGLWASGRYAKADNRSDPGCVVIDEVVGQWLTLSLIYPNARYYAIAFVAFRLFDIIKPWPVSWLDHNVKGGLGIMADDVAAGIYAGVFSYVIYTALIVKQS